MRDFYLLVLLLASLPLLARAQTNDEGSLPWGINAVALSGPVLGAPSLDELLIAQPHTISLKQFYRAGSVNIPATPTECHIAYNSSALLVIFRCTETNMLFPAKSHGEEWYSLLASPPDQDAAFPDKVDLFIQPNMDSISYYQFTATLDGLKFGCKHEVAGVIESNEDNDASPHFIKVKGFKANVVRSTNEWTVLFQIPWSVLGGKPKDFFGLLPIRTRWRNGEVSSPVAMDFAERPPADLFIETHFAGSALTLKDSSSLCSLPSGALRWQRPASLCYPNAQTIQQIWEMQQSLQKPTDRDNFSDRLCLLQRWTDLLVLEGFNFRPTSGSIVKQDLTPSVLRREINTTLRRNDKLNAYQLLDAYLLKLDEASKDWFADGSPGDISKGEWIPITQINHVETNGNILLMRCVAGNRLVNLHLSSPQTGGVRIYGDDEGFFKPANLLPLSIRQSPNECSITTETGKIIINQAPFKISFWNRAGDKIMTLGSNSIAFRFAPSGKPIAIDFKNHLDVGEVIYGFGERYDHFNENSNVFTLWGMDNWIGNTVGLMNQTYKPVPVFHSTKGYSVFDSSTYRLRADVGMADPKQYRLTQQGPIFDYYFWIEPPSEALQSYTDLTGKPVLPPKWAFEPWMGRTGRGWRNTPSHDPVAEEEDVVERFSKLDIPHSAIYSEGSGADSPALNRFMAARGIKVLSWYYPVIPESKQKSLMPELTADQLPLLNAGSQSASRAIGYVDFSNTNALELSRRWWKQRLELGVAGSMVDFGDRVPEEAIFTDGKRGDEMHNFYSYDYQKTYSTVFREKHGDDFILIGRAAAPGTQKWVAQFAGDHSANFEGLQGVLTGALNLSSCGFSTWGSDLGGFLGWPEPAVYMRWTQFACFSPLMRCHGRTPREPWNYRNEALANYKYFAWVRENLLDYIYDAAVYASQHGIPVMRPMAVAYPDKPSLADVQDEYMFGEDLLVAPVVTENNSRKISFPAGKWTSLWTGEAINGPTNFIIFVPLSRIPVYVRQGAVLPVELSKNLQFGESMTSGSVKALLFTPPEKSDKSNTTDLEVGNNNVQIHAETNGFLILLKYYSEDYLLVYGLETAGGVRLNGKNLPKFSSSEFASAEEGWMIDLSGRRLIIRLPENQTSRGDSREQVELILH